MSLLSDEEISQISLSAVTVKDATEDVRAIEAAILAKLAAKELPEPNVKLHGKGKGGKLSDHVVELYDAAQLQQAHAQGFAAGAAAQLAEKPLGWCGLSIDGNHIAHFDGKPLFMAGSQGNEIHPTPLYTRREAK